ncbi:hypothetical protein N8529_00550 [bacterium]|nr:hypothetical protein [bacterium]
MKRIIVFFSLIIFQFTASAKEQLFFARETHPLEISPDGSRLFLVDSPGARLSIFATGAAPVLIKEIPVGLLPVAVRLRTPDEAWVVNELSDSISVVSLSKGAVVKTIQTGDEPGDVAFSGGNAYITCARDNRLDIVNLETYEKSGEIPLSGLFPRSIVKSPDGSRLYVSFLMTSNGTTILPRSVAPPQERPEWTNPELPAAPQTGKIVSTDHPGIPYQVRDHDLAIIDLAGPTTSYRGGLGTNIFNLAVLPDGRVLIPNSEARNLITFEPELRGRFTISRLAIVDETEFQQLDLNSDPDLTFPEIDDLAATTAIAQVMSTLPDSDDQHVWLAAFGSDRLAKLRMSDLTITQRIDLRSNDPSIERNGQTVRGPRGLAIHPDLPHLYVFNKLSHTLATIDRNTFEIIAETPVGSAPDLSPSLKLGRAFLFDARLSGNGSVSCASCHIDLERDGMAWDLGNPKGEIFSVPGAFLSLHAPDIFEDRKMHPMKGPMVTQTLLGLVEQTKLHWRGDKPSIQSFNSTFPDLLAGNLLEESEMDLVTNYLHKLRHHPNPNLQLDRNLPAELNGGNPSDGIAVYTLFDNHCSACHLLPSGSSNNIDIPSTVGSFQPLKDTPFRTTYQRIHFDPTPGGISPSGYGIGSDGSLHQLPIGHPYTLHILDDINRPPEVREKEKRDLAAFILSFDSGTAPAIGHSETFSAQETGDARKLARLTILEAQSSLGQFSEVSIVAHGLINGIPRSFHFDPELNLYHPDMIDEVPARASDLLTRLTHTDVMTFTGVPIGEVTRLSTDRNLNHIPDRSEPPPTLQIQPDGTINWGQSATSWYPEFSNDFQNWLPLTTPRRGNDGLFFQNVPDDIRKGFLRLRNTN